jgi:hypothetical protein
LVLETAELPLGISDFVVCSEKEELADLLVGDLLVGEDEVDDEPAVLLPMALS